MCAVGPRACSPFSVSTDLMRDTLCWASRTRRSTGTPTTSPRTTKTFRYSLDKFVLPSSANTPKTSADGEDVWARPLRSAERGGIDLFAPLGHRGGALSVPNCPHRVRIAPVRAYARCRFGFARWLGVDGSASNDDRQR